MSANLQSHGALVAARRRQWQQLTPQQRTAKIQRALLDTLDYARKRQRSKKAKP